MAAYVEAIFSALTNTLGEVHNESYILVHEVPGASYGFGGKTQEFRFIEGRLKTAA
jgi:4-oxalocrotonate tautomerase